MVERVAQLKKHMRPGRTYRRAELLRLPFSSSLDRDLRVLVAAGEVEKVGGGLYFRPRSSRFGTLPADRGSLLRSFLKSEDFLVMSLNSYNALGVGTTQLYNLQLVYNHKRDGRMELDGMNYYFIKSRQFPRKPTKEFLFVDLVNNLHLLAEDTVEIKERLAQTLSGDLLEKVRKLAGKYGTARSLKFFDALARGRRGSHG